MSFVPRESKVYAEKFVFEINGLTQREVAVSGVGTHLRIELIESRQKTFDIGTLQIGQASKRLLQLVNRSAAPVDFNLLFEPKSEILSNDKSIIRVEPTQIMSLKPEQVCDVQFKFMPKLRIPKFSEELLAECVGVTLPICAVTGACHGHNIWLETNTMPFGAIAQRCSASKRLIMHNDGDIGASFKWETDRMLPEFAIFPSLGYISPGMEVHFDITFSPTELAPDLRKENVRCFIEGLQTLNLTLSGSCVQVVPQKETYNFEACVRQEDMKQITIMNRTNAIWELKPVVDGEYFSGLEALVVEAQSSKAYDVSYKPMTMTIDGKKHTGSVFFPLPDGTGLLYNLSGLSNPPKLVGRYPKDVQCKTPFVETLNVENWLKKPQRFKVSFEVIKPEKPDPSTTIKGNDYLDVPGNGRKEYKLNYFAHKEGVTVVRVIFRNEQTGEYCFYECVFKAVKSSSVGVIELLTQVRIPVSYSIKLENPLPNMVTFTATCTNITEVLIPTSLSIIGKGQVRFIRN